MTFSTLTFRPCSTTSGLATSAAMARNVDASSAGVSCNQIAVQKAGKASFEFEFLVGRRLNWGG